MVGLLRLGALVAVFWTVLGISSPAYAMPQFEQRWFSFFHRSPAPVPTPGGKTSAPEIDPSAAGAAAALAAGGALLLRNRRSRGSVK
jgi:hypothetical protein